jgi:hypothetical protein
VVAAQVNYMGNSEDAEPIRDKKHDHQGPIPTRNSCSRRSTRSVRDVWKSYEFLTPKTGSRALHYEPLRSGQEQGISKRTF